MLNGLYQCTKNWQGNNEYDIKVRVKETEKSYSMQLVENNSRYSPGHIDMLFSKKDKIMIKKEKSQHSMNVWSDNDFTIYPFRAGIPFHFEKITIADPLRQRRSADMHKLSNGDVIDETSLGGAMA